MSDTNVEDMMTTTLQFELVMMIMRIISANYFLLPLSDDKMKL